MRNKTIPEYLPALLPYRGFVTQALAQSEHNDDAVFFTSRLSDIDEPTLPFGLINLQGDGSQIEEVRQSVDSRLAKRIRQLAKRLEVSSAVLFHIGWALVVARTSGRNDVVFGTVLSGRLQGTVDADRVIGMFINTLPLRLSLCGKTVQQMVYYTQDELIELLNHEQASLALAQRCSGVSATTPLFSAMFNYRHNAQQDQSTASNDIVGITLLSGQGHTQYSFDLSVDDFGENFDLVAKTGRQVEPGRITAYLHTAMESLVAALESAPDTDVLNLAVLPEIERHQILEVFNNTKADYPTDKLIHQLFEEQVARNSDALAVVFEDQQLTYGELNAKANQLAHYLREQGISPDSLVAICVERSLEMIVGLLGILKAGVAYVPLDLTYPAERIAYMLEDANPNVILTQERLLDSLPPSQARVVALDRDWHHIASQATTNLDPCLFGLNPTHLAYVIYTSGSTGLPKGVMNEHRGIINRLQWMQKEYQLTPSDRVLQKTSFSFDVSVWEFFWPLMTGAVLIEARPLGHQDTDYLKQIIQDKSITTLHFVPSMLQAFLGKGSSGSCRGLRHIMCSGEELPLILQNHCLEKLPQAKLHNLYGPTEAAIDVTYWNCRFDSNLSRVPIGRPISNTQIYILDTHQQPVPIGVTGELYIGGAGVARGYLNRPELTAERFIASPFSTEPGVRLYKTGDLGRWLPDGNIEFLGRNDHQVKMRGFRIELGEIEAQLVRLPNIREAIVLAREDVPNNKRLVAYLTLIQVERATNLAALDIDSVRKTLRAILPDYMVPSAFVILDAFPLTSNGKLDRKAFPAPDQTLQSQFYEAPQGAIEESLAVIWQDILHIKRVGRCDHFFDLGGHSLLAVQAIARIQPLFGYQVVLRDLFLYPVLQDFARLLQNIEYSDQMPIVPANRLLPLPLSWAQQRLWFINQLEGAGVAYHIPGALRLIGTLDKAALQAAFDQIVTRHEVLRTTFKSIDGAPLQVIADHSTFTPAFFDLGNFYLETREAEVDRLIAEVAHAPFDLVTGPLIRGCLIRLSENEHVLGGAMHHIISDGWSIGILIKEFTALYTAFCEGHATPLPPLAIQYADYALWQQHWLSGKALEDQINYWTQHLLGAPTLLELPADHPRPQIQSYAGNCVNLTLDASLCADLKSMTQQHGVTLFMLLYTAWAILLARLSGQDEVVIGTAIAGRQRTELESLIGFFVNTLALRADLSGNPTVNTLLNQVREITLGALSHQDIPFEQVVEAIQPPRSLSHAPIFQVMFVLQNTPHAEAPQLPGLTLVPQAIDRHTAQFDLTLSLSEADGQIAGTIEYATDLFDQATIERWIGHFQLILRAMVMDAEQTVRDIPLLSKTESHQILEVFNDTEADYPKDKLIHQLFEEQVARNSDAIAVVFEDQQLTYGELNAKANQLARYLRKLGVLPDTRVGICIEKSLDMIVSLLAILKAGGSYVPLDPSYPSERLKFILLDSKPVVVLTDESTETIFYGIVGKFNTLVITTFPCSWMKEASVNLGYLETGLTSKDIAYVIYTSGSTGEPKAIEMPHQALLNLITWQTNNNRITARARTLQYTSINFDVSFQEMFSSWCADGTLILIDNAARYDSFLLLKFLEQHVIQRLYLPYVALERLAQFAVNQKIYPENLCEVITAGEQLRINSDIKEFFSKLKGCRLINQYGPAETHVVTAFELPQNANDWQILPPIGRPISNTQIYILDTQGQPVPIGVSGELYISGAGVARGYLNRPDLTVERFLPDLFVEQSHARMYKTGDLGRWLPDGNIEFIGRNDDQIKIRGFRIEPGEIESALSQYPGVSTAVVIAQGDGPDKRLVAYYTGAERLSAEILREHLGVRLPNYMIPAAYIYLQAFPLTPNGKLDRKALPDPNGDAYAVRAYKAPLGDTEQTLADIWSNLLNVDRVGRHDNFFELGGHSLLAVQVISRLRLALGVEATLANLFAQPVLSDFAHSLNSAEVSEFPSIHPVNRQERLALSFAQQRLWFLAQLDSTSTAYHITSNVRLIGELNVTALRQALDHIILRHEVLRTTFIVTDGAPEIRISAVDTGFLLIEHNLCFQADAEILLQELATREAQEKFDLKCGPLIRGRLIKLADKQYVLLMTQHHIVSDGWSMGILAKELSTLYSAIVEGANDPLPPLPVQYADHAAWQRQWMTGDRLHAQASYWQTTLAGVPTLLELPTDHPRPAQQNDAGDHIEVQLDAELTVQLKALSLRHGATLHMTLLASWALLLARLSGQSDVVIGIPSANREREEIEHLIGFFVNTLAIRIELSDELTVAELLKYVKQQTLAAQANQDIPFEQVVDILQPPRSLAHAPLFQVMFAWQNTPQDKLELRGLTLSPFETAQHHTAKFDLTLWLEQRDEAIVGGIEYACALFKQSTVKRYLSYWITLLKHLVIDDQQLVAKLPLLSASERQTVLYEWNATQADYPKHQCIHELFEDQVAKAPDAIAVVHKEQQLSFAELNRRANRLARHLRQIGVEPDALVGICVERGLDMIIGLLGILKAGGAYVPLDPGYPRERLQFMLEDSVPIALLCEAGTEGILNGLASGIPRVNLSAEPSPWAKQSSANLGRHKSGQTSEHLAYVIYTSGSTGKPKGVSIVHRNTVALISWANGTFKKEENAGVLASTSFCFDLSVFEFFVPLTQGGHLILVDNLLQLVASHGINEVALINTVPSAMHSIVDAGRIPNSTHMINLAGEPLSGALVERIFTNSAVDFICNLYGPTETTTYSTWVKIKRGAGFPHHVGRPIANTRIYILDRQCQPVPIGVTGELYIGGAGVARGYLNRPALTAERFLLDPFAEQSHARMYKTGDLGRWLPDGNIDFIGRNDDQVKIRGFRIELGEIESALSQYPGVSTAVVIAQGDGPDKRLIAYYTGPEFLSAETLRAYLGVSLPNYMIPAAYVYLKAFPLTPNGKLDRKVLPDPDGDAYAVRAYEAPLDGIEQTLADIWSNLLNVDRVGRHDNFFELGGHSLLAITLLSLVKTKFQTDIPIAAVFNSPTIHQMAALLNSPAISSSLYSLFLIHQGTPSPALFWAEYTTLDNKEVVINLMDIDKPIYGLRYALGAPPGSSISFPPTIERLATHYIEQLFLAQQNGPYFLIGHSWGGLVAYEMAQQLTSLKQDVAIVFLSDTFCPELLVKSLPIGKQIADFLLITPTEFMKRLKAYFKSWKRFIRNKVAFYFRGSNHYYVDRFNGELVAHITKKYTPKNYSGRVVLFKAMDHQNSQYEHIEPVDVKWRILVGEKLEVHEIPGSHKSHIKGQGAIQVANIIARAMDSVTINPRISS